MSNKTESEDKTTYTRELECLSREIYLLHSYINNLHLPHTMKILSNRMNVLMSSLQNSDLLEQEKIYLPAARGPILPSTHKLYITETVNIKQLIGPEGRTIKQIETIAGCKLMIRGKGSPTKNRKQSNLEDLKDKLHIRIMVEDTLERNTIRIKKAEECINRLLNLNKENAFYWESLQNVYSTPASSFPLTIQQGLLISSDFPIPITHYHQTQPILPNNS